jgi:hypothetical protein
LDCRDLTLAGEPGVALENICTQLFEYGVAVGPELLDQIREVGQTTNVDAKYWRRLAPTDIGCVNQSS